MNISVNELANLGDVNIIDIRGVEKYNSRHIPGAINIPYEKLISNPSNYLNKGDRYYIYCQHGNTSLNICKILVRSGYDVVNVDGGYEAWILS